MNEIENQQRATRTKLSLIAILCIGRFLKK